MLLILCLCQKVIKTISGFPLIDYFLKPNLTGLISLGVGRCRRVIHDRCGNRAFTGEMGYRNRGRWFRTVNTARRGAIPRGFERLDRNGGGRRTSGFPRARNTTRVHDISRRSNAY